MLSLDIVLQGEWARGRNVEGRRGWESGVVSSVSLTSLGFVFFYMCVCDVDGIE